jgi:hypothetical protein
MGSNSLPDLARQIVEQHELIANAPKTAYRAIMLGKLLTEAKNHDGQYGKWATWLKENCRGMSERTAQRYMQLASAEDKLKSLCAAMKDKKGNPKPSRVTDLSYREAYDLITSDDREKKQKKREAENPPNYHNEYVAVEEELIEKLELLNEKVGGAAIKEAAERTVRCLRNTVDHLLAKVA